MKPNNTRRLVRSSRYPNVQLQCSIQHRPQSEYMRATEFLSAADKYCRARARGALIQLRCKEQL